MWGAVSDNSFWSSAVQSCSDPSPAGLMTIFDCLRFETFPNRMAQLYPPGTGFPFLSPLTTRRATVGELLVLVR
jgi:hypothetical protein